MTSSNVSKKGIAGLPAVVVDWRAAKGTPNAIYIKVESEPEVEGDERVGEYLAKAGDHSTILKQTLRTFALVLAVDLMFAATVCAQEATSDRTSSATSTVDIDRPLTRTSPAVSSSPPPHFAPMTGNERFHNYLSNVFGYEVILRSAVGAGIRQANGKPEEWGGGTEGYARRFASGFGQHFVSGTLQYGISSLLHEDNRYFASGQTGTFRRLTYAIKSTVLARHDDGKQYFSISHVTGTAGGAFISRTWSPPSISDARHGAVSFGVSMSYAMGFNVFREFWPDVKRIF